MKEINPSVMASIHDTAFRLSEVATVYHQDRDNKIKQIVKKSSEDFMQVSIADILNDIAPDSFLYELLSPLGFKSDQMKDIRRCMEHSQSGKRFLSKEWELVRDREDLLIYRTHHQEAVPELLVEEMEYTSDFVIPRNKYIACLDADKVETPLTIRKWQTGDKFVPFGMTGKKKVSDYLTDRKMSLYQKDNQYVVCSGDHIVWLVNERSDNRFRITSQTKRVLLVQIKKGR
jgi:tRNA(Ile)-lysidine synthase